MQLECAPLTQDAIKNEIKARFGGKPIFTLTDERQWSISYEFTANKEMPRGATLTIYGSCYMPLSDVIKEVAWMDDWIEIISDGQ